MAIIEFDNGMKVEFNGTPTQKDVEEVYNKIKGNFPDQTPKKMPLLTKETGGFGTALKDVGVGAVKSFVRGGRDLASLAQKAGKGILGAFGADTSQMGIKSIDDTTPEGMQVAEQLKSKSRAEQVGGALETIAELGTSFVKSGIPQAVKTYKAGKQIATQAKQDIKLAKTISPEFTTKEARLAQTQGRFFEGKPATLIKSSTPDQIATTDKVFNAVQTIKKEIPNAHKLTPSDLYTTLKSNIADKSNKLKPILKKIPIKDESVQKINTRWETLKKAQLEAVDATDETNVLKLQKQFEEKLMKTGSKTYDDLWEARKAYDESIPSQVKRANSMSPMQLQLRKDIWLQNRAILNDVIGDAGNSMGESTKIVFNKMSDLYEAMNNLLAKTKAKKTIEPSKVKQLIKKHPTASTLIGGAVGGGAITKLLSD